MDLPTVQAFLVSHGGTPLAVTPVVAGHRRRSGSRRRWPAALPPGAAVTSRAALTAATLADPLSAAPQQALLAMAVAAALLAITGFWVSIAADVRQRRAENALLAALGVTQRSAAARLFLEKLLLSVPSAVLGLVLGLVVARLLVPAVTLTATAQTPVPPPERCFDLSQTLPLAAAVAVLPGAGRRPRRLPPPGPGGRAARGGGSMSTGAASGHEQRQRRRAPRASTAVTPPGVNVWLALLTLFVVFAATAGVREALATRTEALRQTLAAAPALSSTIAVDGAVAGRCRPRSAGPYQRRRRCCRSRRPTEIASQLRGDLNQGVVRLAPALGRLDGADHHPAEPADAHAAGRRTAPRSSSRSPTGSR